MHTKSHTQNSSAERSFTINNAYHVDGCPTKFSNKDYTGRFISRDPYSAAAKALSHMCHVKNIRGQCTLYIEMRETTQGSKHKHYGYHCKRVRLSTPVVVGGVERHYDVEVKSADIPTEKCTKSHKSSGQMKHYKKSHKGKSSHHSKKTQKNNKH
jgi:hypothetical protein